jgi:hypothetical protein
MAKVNVYAANEVVARVEYNQDLDHWDGSNWTCGATGRHKGITRLTDGRFVLIHGTQWQGESDHAEIISPVEALQEILRSGNDDLLDQEKFSDLKEIKQKSMVQEMEG